MTTLEAVIAAAIILGKVLGIFVIGVPVITLGAWLIYRHDGGRTSLIDYIWDL